jgi:hypothetical protein
MQFDPGSPENFTTHGSTGPRNAATGLYAACDFIRPAEEEEYAQTLNTLMDELPPKVSPNRPSPSKSWEPPGVSVAAAW